MGVSKWILHQLGGLGIRQPSAVQAACIPAVLAVVLTPTRELAAQIGDSFRSLGRAGMNL